MAKPEHPLLEQFREETGRLGNELQHMAALRWQLARLEIESDLRQGRRLAVGLAIAAMMAAAAVALLCTALAGQMETWAGGSRAGWLVLFAAVLFSIAAVTAWLAWRTFRRRFTGLEETLEELREDAVWIGEWMKKDEG